MPPVKPLIDSRPIIAICAATGRQGSSVVDWLCSDGTFRVRGLTRNPGKPEARCTLRFPLLQVVRALLTVTASKVLEERGVDVFQAEFDDFESLVSAFTGVFGVYAVTDCKPSTIRCTLGPADSIGRVRCRRQ
jgi:uncharacterized protein YbjT (DUF2867 family)